MLVTGTRVSLASKAMLIRVMVRSLMVEGMGSVRLRRILSRRSMQYTVQAKKKKKTLIEQ